jgi:hypothetical protein
MRSVRTGRGDEWNDQADDLVATNPPLPLILFNIVAGLRDRLPKGYPVKKLLLLLWKTLLACLGGMKEVNKAKALSRELAGLIPDSNGQFCYHRMSGDDKLTVQTLRKPHHLTYPHSIAIRLSSTPLSNQLHQPLCQSLRTNYQTVSSHYPNEQIIIQPRSLPLLRLHPYETQWHPHPHQTHPFLYQELQHPHPLPRHSRKPRNSNIKPTLLNLLYSPIPEEARPILLL